MTNASRSIAERRGGREMDRVERPERGRPDRRRGGSKVGFEADDHEVVEQASHVVELGWAPAGEVRSTSTRPTTLVDCG